METKRNNQTKDLIIHRSHFVDQQLIFLILFSNNEIEEWQMELLSDYRVSADN